MCMCVQVMVPNVFIYVGKAGDIFTRSGEYKSGLLPLSHGKALSRSFITGDSSMVFFTVRTL